MENCGHFIVTRFNVNIDPVEFDFRLSPSWLAERFELFNRFCFPSVRGQRCQAFTWLVLFDEKTPPPFRKIIHAYERYENFRPLFCGAFEEVVPAVIEEMLRLQPEAQYLLSTRLDNDDALARSFVGILHEVARSLLQAPSRGEAALYLNFPNGLQYADGVVYDFRDITNAFVSLLEPAAAPRSVFWVDHPTIYDVAEVLQVETRPIFLQNVHGQNVYNYIRGTASQEPEPLRDFALAL